MSMERLPFERRPRNSIANNLDRINELIDWVNLDTHLYASASGERVTVDDASSVKGLTVDGRSVQNGTPTPDAPVPVQVVEGKNLLPNISSTNRTHNGITFSISENRIVANGTSTAMSESSLITLDTPVTLEAGKLYTISLNGEYSVSGSSTLFVFYDKSSTAVFNSGSQSNGIWTFAPTATMNLKYMRFRVNTAGATVNIDANIQLEEGSTPTPYVPYGSIGIVVGDTATSINLQGNTLAGLPDGTHDELHVDSVGHCVLTKNVGKTTIDGSLAFGSSFKDSSTMGGNCTRITMNMSNFPTMKSAALNETNSYMSIAVAGSTAASETPDPGVYSKTSTSGVYLTLPSTLASASDVNAWLTANNFDFLYPLATPQTIDLGYIDPPAIPSGSVVTISASLTPTFHLEWWVDDGITALVDDLIAYIDYKTEG